MTRAGIVTVVGKPNAGKSTLLNRIVGQKLSIVSPKPQSTRNRVVGIHSAQGVQMVLLDTPGLLDPTYPLQHAMLRAALEALDDADVVVYVADVHEGTPPPLERATALGRAPRAPTLVALNKVDTLTTAQRQARCDASADVFCVSALTGQGLAELLQRVSGLLPESPFLYPEDEISTHSLRFFAAELVRETALEQLEDEVPYSIACEVEEFREDHTPVYIRAVLYVERESQKRILIGASGQRIRAIGRAARGKIEAFLEQRVYLDLWVKVLPNWRRSAAALSRFGFRLPEEQSS